VFWTYVQMTALIRLDVLIEAQGWERVGTDPGMPSNRSALSLQRYDQLAICRGPGILPSAGNGKGLRRALIPASENEHILVETYDLITPPWRATVASYRRRNGCSIISISLKSRIPHGSPTFAPQL